MTDELRTLSGGDRIVIEYESVRARGERRTLETTVADTKLTPDDPNVVELAEFHSDKDRYPRRRILNVRNPDAPLRLEERRSTERGAVWGLYGDDVEVVETGPAPDDERDADDDEGGEDADEEPEPAVVPADD